VKKIKNVFVRRLFAELNVATPILPAGVYRLVPDPVSKIVRPLNRPSNSDNGSKLAEALVKRAAEAYGWPELPPLADD